MANLKAMKSARAQRRQRRGSKPKNNNDELNDARSISKLAEENEESMTIERAVKQIEATEPRATTQAFDDEESREHDI